MRIVPLQSEHMRSLYALYRDSTAAVPHARLVPTFERFAAELLVPHSRGGLYEPPLHADILVSEANEAVTACAAMVRRRHEGSERASITALFFRDAADGAYVLRAAEALVEDELLEAYPAEHGVSPIRAYNAGWDGLSDRLPGVSGLLARFGYTPYHRELHLELAAPSGLLPPPPPGVRIDDRAVPAGSAERAVEGWMGDERVGGCWYCQLDALSDAPGATQTGYITWLHVEPRARRRGIARALLGTALQRLVLRGCDQIWLTTAADNWAAQQLYASYGFGVVDASVSLRKLRSL